MAQKYPPIPPKRKWFKELVCQIALFVLGRTFQSAAKFDQQLKREIAEWPEGFRLIMRVLPHGPFMAMEKTNGQLRYRGRKLKDADLTINFKNIESAFLVLTPQMGATQAFAENRLSVVGDLIHAMAFTRCLNILLTYLYPKFITKRLVKRVSPLTISQLGWRVYLYMVGIPLGR